MRQLIIEHQLDQVLFDNIADKPVRGFGVDAGSQLIDSVHIQSNMRKRVRIRIFR